MVGRLVDYHINIMSASWSIVRFPVAGRLVDYRINVIVPPGASPATFEPPPSVIRSLQQSKLIVFNGYLGFEQAWMDKLMQVNPDINVLYLASNQELIAAEQHKHGDHYHYDGVDPHFWMSPLSARQIALDIQKCGSTPS